VWRLASRSAEHTHLFRGVPAQKDLFYINDCCPFKEANKKSFGFGLWGMREGGGIISAD
jgi:hypothetical protein